MQKNVKREDVKRFSYRPGMRGVVYFSGTREQIKKHKVEFKALWKYGIGKYDRQAPTKTYYPGIALKNGLEPKTYKDEIWKIGKKGAPDLHLRVRFKRLS